MTDTDVLIVGAGPWAIGGDFGGRLLHASEYERPDPFEGDRVLVVGPGRSGMEIAAELAGHGAAKVWLAVRTPPNIMLREGPGGLPVPDEGVMSRLRRLGAAPSVVDRDVIDAITTGRVELVAAVESLNEDAVRLTDGSSLTPDAVICATGYRPGLETSAFWTTAAVRRRSERRRPRRASASSATCRARAASGTAASRPGEPHA